MFAETSLYKLATKGNVRALVAWLQARRPEDWNGGPVNHPLAEPPRPTAIFYIPSNGRERETKTHRGDETHATAP